MVRRWYGTVPGAVSWRKIPWVFKNTFSRNDFSLSISIFKSERRGLTRLNGERTAVRVDLNEGRMKIISEIIEPEFWKIWKILKIWKSCQRSSWISDRSLCLFLLAIMVKKLTKIKNIDFKRLFKRLHLNRNINKFWIDTYSLIQGRSDTFWFSRRLEFLTLK